MSLNLRGLLTGLTRTEDGCWVSPLEATETAETRLLLWEQVNGRPTRGKRPEPFCGREGCVNPAHQDLSEETRAARVPRVCGTCASIRYKGGQLLTLEEGTCQKWKQSGHYAVQSECEGCPLWTRRPARTRKRDEAQADLVQIFVESYNAGIKAKKKRR